MARGGILAADPAELRGWMWGKGPDFTVAAHFADMPERWQVARARFTLVEAYRTAEAVAAHKATAHYARWRDAVADMMAEPRTAMKYAHVFPTPESW